MKIAMDQKRRFIMRWANMLDRCENPENKHYSRYGGRGIKVCDEWQDFRVYINDLPENYFEGAQLDRIDNDGDYESSNVRWVTRVANCANRPTTHVLEFNGKKQSLNQWSKELGINISSLMERLDRGWTVEEALSKPKGFRLFNKNGERIQPKPFKVRQVQRLYYRGEEYTMSELSDLSGIPVKLLRKRINERDWGVKRAVETPVKERINA